MDETIFYFYTKGKEKRTQKKIGIILRDMILNKDFFVNNGVNNIATHYNISKKSLLKYLRDFRINRKNNRDKRIFFKKRIDLQFFIDMERIIKKYEGLLDEKIIEKGKYYLNNL